MPSDFAVTPIRNQQSQADAVAAAQAPSQAMQAGQGSGQAASAAADAAPSPAAPSANIDPAPTFHVDSRLGIAVVELQDQKGNIVLSMPSQKAITAYLSGTETSLNPSAVAAPGESGQTNTTA